jgi:hypothetical protein
LADGVADDDDDGDDGDDVGDGDDDDDDADELFMIARDHDREVGIGSDESFNHVMNDLIMLK